MSVQMTWHLVSLLSDASLWPTGTQIETTANTTVIVQPQLAIARAGHSIIIGFNGGIEYRGAISGAAEYVQCLYKSQVVTTLSRVWSVL